MAVSACDSFIDNSIVCINHPLFIQSLLGDHFGYYKCIALGIQAHILYGHTFSILLNIYLEVYFMGSMVTLYLTS